MVERSQLAGRQRGRDKPRTVRQQEFNLLGMRRCVSGDQKAIGLIGPVADKDAVEAGRFMGAAKRQCNLYRTTCRTRE